MQISRTALAALAVAALAAPSASAAVAVDPVPPAADETAPISRYAEIATHRDAISNRHWQQANKHAGRACRALDAAPV